MVRNDDEEANLINEEDSEQNLEAAGPSHRNRNPNRSTHISKKKDLLKEKRPQPVQPPQLVQEQYHQNRMFLDRALYFFIFQVGLEGMICGMGFIATGVCSYHSCVSLNKRISVAVSVISFALVLYGYYVIKLLKKLTQTEVLNMSKWAFLGVWLVFVLFRFLIYIYIWATVLSLLPTRNLASTSILFLLIFNTVILNCVIRQVHDFIQEIPEAQSLMIGTQSPVVSYRAQPQQPPQQQQEQQQQQHLQPPSPLTQSLLQQSSQQLSPSTELKP